MELETGWLRSLKEVDRWGRWVVREEGRTTGEVVDCSAAGEEEGRQVEVDEGRQAEVEEEGRQAEVDEGKPAEVEEGSCSVEEEGRQGWRERSWTLEQRRFLLWVLYPPLV